MNTRKGLDLSGFMAANPMARYSDFAWSDAACNETAGGVGLGPGNNNLAIGISNTTNYFTAGELNLMSRFSLNSSLTLNTAGTDSDTTSSSASSSSATINSSLSLSPANERDNNVRFNNSQNNLKPTQQASNHLLELQKEIKEEEEEIFADINSLINSRSNLYSTFDDEDENVVDDGGTNLNEETPAASFNQLATSTLSNNNNNSQLSDLQNRSAVEILFTNSSDDLNDYQSHGADDKNIHDFQNSSTGSENDDDQSKLESLHQHQYQHETQSRNNPGYIQQNDSKYFHDVEDQQKAMNHEDEAQYFDENQEQVYNESCEQNTDQPDYQALQAVIQQVTNNLPKPCVFFLEGNCRRSDCKYSHDLSNITCKYWIEGFCFKGELCPFSHSYNPPSDSSLLDDDGMQSMPKKELNPTFVIESEADFPSLPLDAPTPAINDSTKSSVNGDILATSIKNQILSSNPAVVFKTVKKKRKRG